MSSEVINGSPLFVMRGEQPCVDKSSSLGPPLSESTPVGVDRPDLPVASANSLRSASNSRSNLNKFVRYSGDLESEQHTCGRKLQCRTLRHSIRSLRKGLIGMW